MDQLDLKVEELEERIAPGIAPGRALMNIGLQSGNLDGVGTWLQRRKRIMQEAGI